MRTNAAATSIDYLAEGEREGNGVLGIVLYGEEASFVEAGDKSVHTRSFWNCKAKNEKTK